MTHTFDFNATWYECWMQQSKVFFKMAENNLKEMFTRHHAMQAEAFLHYMNQWLDTVKKQWNFSQSPEQNTSQAYWNMMTTMCHEAAERMMAEWTRRIQEKNPIQTIQDLYALWLNCCHEVYQKSPLSASNRSR